MWQSLLMDLAVGVAAVYVVWTLMLPRWRALLRARLHLASPPTEGSGAAAPGGANGELPCSNCAHNGALHVRSHH
jgi:hypothetical protein